MKIEQLPAALARVLVLREESVASIADALSKATAIGNPNDEASPEDAARLLVALLASHGPADALQSYESFAAIPLSKIEEVARAHCDSVAWNAKRGLDYALTIPVSIEDWPIPEGDGALWAEFSKSFISALTVLLRRSIEDDASAMGLRMVAAARAPHSPVARIVMAQRPYLPPEGVQGLGIRGLSGDRALIFGHRAPTEQTEESWEGMATGASITGFVIRDIADLLAGRQPQRAQTHFKELA